MRTRLRVYTSVSRVVEHRFPEPLCSGLIEAGRWRANADPAIGGVIVRVHRALVVHLGFLVRRASASLSFDEGSVEKRFGLIGQILAESGRGSGCL